jgi:hypothetical protein
LPGTAGAARLTTNNYEFEAGPADPSGLIPVRVKPRRRDPTLVDGTIFVTPDGAQLVRVVGRLAKSPSFWTRSVEVVRRYEQRAGTQMIVEVRSRADVKLVGVSEFVMTYAYERVDGQAPHEVSPTLVAARLDAGGRSPR